MYDHFSTIASKYQSVRTLDTKPILYIKDKLQEKSKINMAVSAASSSALASSTTVRPNL